MAATTQRVGVSPRASEIWDRAEAMLEVPGTHRWTRRPDLPPRPWRHQL